MEQKRIAEVLSRVDDRILEERNRQHHLQQLNRGLMQELLTGQVRVTPDEQASA